MCNQLEMDDAHFTIGSSRIEVLPSMPNLSVQLDNYTEVTKRFF